MVVAIEVVHYYNKKSVLICGNKKNSRRGLGIMDRRKERTVQMSHSPSPPPPMSPPPPPPP